MVGVKTLAKPEQTTVIAEGLRIRGEVDCTGAIEVRGHIEGHLRCGHLEVTPTGVIAGSIHADSVVINGQVEGPIFATDVVLKANARVVGDIASMTIAIEKGADLEGEIMRPDSARLVVVEPPAS
jgi:cytoskeletal protein CcmA (bactofilin family)